MERGGDCLEHCACRREYFARVDTRRQLSGTLHQCDAQIPRCFSFSHFTRRDQPPATVKIVKHFTHSEHFSSRCKNLRMNCRITLYSRRAFQVVKWAYYIVYIEWYFFSLFLHMSVRILAHAVFTNVSENYMAFLSKRNRIHQHKHALKITSQT